jgi:hypothetical protein
MTGSSAAAIPLAGRVAFHRAADISMTVRFALENKRATFEDSTPHLQRSNTKEENDVKTRLLTIVVAVFLLTLVGKSLAWS